MVAFVEVLLVDVPALEVSLVDVLLGLDSLVVELVLAAELLSSVLLAVSAEPLSFLPPSLLPLRP